MSSSSWWEAAWSFLLSAAVFTSAVTFVIIYTLPPAYSHFRPRHITQEAFPQDSRDESERVKSGYTYYLKHKDATGSLRVESSVQIVVLGDIGRSPRMQYHALSIASHGGLVDLIGYTGSEIHPDILKSGFINIVPITPFPSLLQTNNKILFLILAPLKIIWQTWCLYYALTYRTPPSKWMLVQNPPSIPTLIICQFVCMLRNTRLVVDWHNFGYSILALRLGPTHPLVKFAEWYEGFFSRSASAHFAVTNAMARVLKAKWNITATPLHDRPAEIYQPLSLDQRSTFLHHLPGTATHAEAILSQRCRLVVSSTSWTADEDFSILLSALVQYSSAAAQNPALPNIIAIITGRGPQREHYLREIAALTNSGKLEHVLVTTAWLSPEDYAALLGAADLGVSLHTSSSGVDLPMKVVDMFGTGLPVAGWSRFEAWPELVHEGKNGRGFESAEGLKDILIQLFGGDGKELQRLRDGAGLEVKRRWDDEWMPVAGKLFQLDPD